MENIQQAEYKNVEQENKVEKNNVLFTKKIMVICMGVLIIVSFIVSIFHIINSSNLGDRLKYLQLPITENNGVDYTNKMKVFSFSGGALAKISSFVLVIWIVMIIFAFIYTFNSNPEHKKRKWPFIVLTVFSALGVVGGLIGFGASKYVDYIKVDVSHVDQFLKDYDIINKLKPEDGSPIKASLVMNALKDDISYKLVPIISIIMQVIFLGTSITGIVLTKKYRF